MNTLHDVQIDEISLVDKPANEDCRIILFKRDSSTAVDRAYAALEAVKKALQGAKSESEGDGLQEKIDRLETSKQCDRLLAELVAEQSRREPGADRRRVYLALLDSDLGRQIYAKRQQLAAGAKNVPVAETPEFAEQLKKCHG